MREQLSLTNVREAARHYQNAQAQMNPVNPTWDELDRFAQEQAIGRMFMLAEAIAIALHGP